MKRRIASMFLVVTMLATVLAGEARAGEPGGAEPLCVVAQVDGADIRTSESEGVPHLFLPASADLKKLELRVEAVDGTVTVRGSKGSRELKTTVNLTTLTRRDEEGRYPLEITAGGRTQTLYVMQGSAIPTVYLTSDDPAEHGRDWVDQSKSNETTGAMKLIGPDGTVVYDGDLTQIKPRGNSTFKRYDKKAYQIKLKDKTDLLGSGEKGKTWVLLANYGDATMMHDKLMKDLAAEVGMNYVPDSSWVSLYYDGEYRGVYTLGEKVDVGSTGVDIADMEDAYSALNPAYGDDETAASALNACGQKILYTEGLTEVADVTGGWLIELNHKEPDEINGFHTRKGVAFNLKTPEFAGREAMAYISEYYQAFEDAVYATDAAGNHTGVNAATGKRYDEYVDRDSLVQMYLLQELALNPDAFVSSLYFYKDAGGIMYCGPLWDQDMTLGTGWTIQISPRLQENRYLAEALIRIPDFRAAVTEYYHETFAPAVEKWVGKNGTIAETSALLTDSAAMNYKLWPYVRIGSPAEKKHLWGEDTDYTAVVTTMQEWVETRLGVLNATYSDDPATRALADTVGHSAEEAIRFVVDRGIFSGTGDAFLPDHPMTRAHLVATLHRMAGSPAPTKACSFTDVPADAWYGAALSWAVEAGIVQGYGDTFKPNEQLTRAHLAAMLYRYAAAQGLDVTARRDLSGYMDAMALGQWAKEPMSWALGAGVMEDVGGFLARPSHAVTRGDAAMAYEKFLTKLAD